MTLERRAIYLVQCTCNSSNHSLEWMWTNSSTKYLIWSHGRGGALKTTMRRPYAMWKRSSRSKNPYDLFVRFFLFFFGTFFSVTHPTLVSLQSCHQEQPQEPHQGSMVGNLAPMPLERATQ